MELEFKTERVEFVYANVRLDSINEEYVVRLDGSVERKYQISKFGHVNYDLVQIDESYPNYFEIQKAGLDAIADDKRLEDKYQEGYNNGYDACLNEMGEAIWD